MKYTNEIYDYFFLFKIHILNNTGKITAAKIPVCNCPVVELVTKPTKVGPPEHPKSPAKASKANIVVPPVRREAAAVLNVPGHIIPTDNPVRAQPNKLINGLAVKLVSK